MIPEGGHARFLRRALRLAEQAKRKGNHPFGAVLAQGGRILMEAENTVVRDGDPTQHAELRLVSRAARRLPARILGRSTLYASTEPCALCAGAIYWTGIRKVVFGCSARALGRMAGGDLVIPCRRIFRCGRKPTRVIGPILEAEARAPHESFWSRAS